MKPIYSNRYRRDDEAYKNFKSLWLVDDHDWIEKRKQEWNLICGEKIDRSNPGVQFRGRFYVYGEECPDYIEGDGLSDRDIIKFEFSHRLAYTPFTNKEQVQEMWDLSVELLGFRNDHHGMARYVDSKIKNLPDHADRIKIIAEALFCERYFCQVKQGRRRKVWISIKPKDFISSYCTLIPLINEHERMECDFRCFSLGYFLKCIEVNEESVDECQNKNIGMYKNLLSKEDDSLSFYFLDLKNKLITIAKTGENKVLQAAYEEAQ